MEDHIKYMKRALELAQHGLGFVSPNPLVGCVIVHNSLIIGEGFHQLYGGPHAEVNAIHSVKNQPLLSSSIMYVTLEPCSHFGKTPPCADLIISHRIPKVVICNLDPNPLVAGKGIEKLKNAGITVVTGVLEDQGRFINRRFFTYIEKKRPYIILKWAQTNDGFIDLKRESHEAPLKISDALNSKTVHQWRMEEDAIWIGKNTIVMDNPSLTTRKVVGRNPVRITYDRSNSLESNFNFFQQNAQQIIFNHEKNMTVGQSTWIKLKENNIEQMISSLLDYKIQSIMVEGGTHLLNLFIENDMWDEARISKHKSLVVEKGVEAPTLLSGYLNKVTDESAMIVEYYRNE